MSKKTGIKEVMVETKDNSQIEAKKVMGSADTVAEAREIFLRIKIKIHELKVPGLDKTVYVRELTGRQRQKLEKLSIGSNRASGAELMAKLTVYGCCDKNGLAVFNETTSDDEKMLMQGPMGIIETIGKRIMQISGIGSDDELEEV